jgi:hypothetical protein
MAGVAVLPLEADATTAAEADAEEDVALGGLPVLPTLSSPSAAAATALTSFLDAAVDAAAADAAAVAVVLVGREFAAELEAEWEAMAAFTDLGITGGGAIS